MFLLRLFKVAYFPKISKEYIKQLVNDIEISKKQFNKFKTIYIGGGTPSILSYEELEILLSQLKPLLRKMENLQLKLTLSQSMKIN